MKSELLETVFQQRCSTARGTAGLSFTYHLSFILPVLKSFYSIESKIGSLMTSICLFDSVIHL